MSLHDGEVRRSCRRLWFRRDGVWVRPSVRLYEGVLLFLFFSNRLGCLGSLVLSIALTALLILLLSR
jgi:hypothetical protein